MSIIVLRYARRRMRIVSQGPLALWRRSALRCDVTPRYALTWLFIRKTPSYKTYTCLNVEGAITVPTRHHISVPRGCSDKGWSSVGQQEEEKLLVPNFLHCWNYLLRWSSVVFTWRSTMSSDSGRKVVVWFCLPSASVLHLARHETQNLGIVHYDIRHFVGNGLQLVPLGTVLTRVHTFSSSWTLRQKVFLKILMIGWPCSVV